MAIARSSSPRKASTDFAQTTSSDAARLIKELSWIPKAVRSYLSRARFSRAIDAALGDDAFHCRGLAENIWNVLAPSSAARRAAPSRDFEMEVCKPIRITGITS